MTETRTPSAAPVVVRNVRQTCDACPAQWEGDADDGRKVYARYRWGYLRVTAAATIDEAMLRGETLFEWESHNEWDGWMSDTELALLTAGRIEWHSEEPA